MYPGNARGNGIKSTSRPHLVSVKCPKPPFSSLIPPVIRPTTPFSSLISFIIRPNVPATRPIFPLKPSIAPFLYVRNFPKRILKDIRLIRRLPITCYNVFHSFGSFRMVYKLCYIYSVFPEDLKTHNESCSESPGSLITIISINWDFPKI